MRAGSEKDENFLQEKIFSYTVHTMDFSKRFLHVYRVHAFTNMLTEASKYVQ